MAVKVTPTEHMRCGSGSATGPMHLPRCPGLVHPLPLFLYSWKKDLHGRDMREKRCLGDWLCQVRGGPHMCMCVGGTLHRLLSLAAARGGLERCPWTDHPLPARAPSMAWLPQGRTSFSCFGGGSLLHPKPPLLPFLSVCSMVAPGSHGSLLSKGPCDVEISPIPPPQAPRIQGARQPLALHLLLLGSG